MKYLWVEDFDSSPSEEKIQRAYERYGFTKEDTILADTFIGGLKYIAESPELFDAVVLDVDLDIGGTPEDYKALVAGVLSEEMSLGSDNVVRKTDAGFYLYIKLLDIGFPKERICFLTGNTNNDTACKYSDFLKWLSENELDVDLPQEDMLKRIDPIKGKLNAELNKIKLLHMEVAEALKNGKGTEAANILKGVIDKMSNDSNKVQTAGDWKKRFVAAGMRPPETYQKLAGVVKFQEWKKQQKNSYYMLRRAIVQASIEIADMLSQNSKLVRFGEYVDDDKERIYNKEYFIDIMDSLAQLLPIREPGLQNKKFLYKQVVKIISHDFEGIDNKYIENGIKPKKKMGYTVKGSWKDRNSHDFAMPEVKAEMYSFEHTAIRILKKLRNCVAHSTIREFDEADIAFLFLLAMRVFFRLPVNKVYEYEELLLELINDKPISEKELRDILHGEGRNKFTRQLTDSLINLMNLYFSKQKFTKANEIDRISILDTVNVYKIISGIISNAKIECDKEKCGFFYKLFWHNMFYLRLRHHDSAFNIEYYINKTDNAPCDKSNIITRLHQSTYHIFEN
ncbi:MAG TPA: hypothetical protein VEG39_09200 [Clostridia bacterium]|nr:hypothetical protein [Clostridia bacterium]